MGLFCLHKSRRYNIYIKGITVKKAELKQLIKEELSELYGSNMYLTQGEVYFNTIVKFLQKLNDEDLRDIDIKLKNWLNKNVK